MPKRKPITQEIQNRIVELYQEHKNAAEVARILGIHPNTVNDHLKRYRGVCIRCQEPVSRPLDSHCENCKTKLATYRKQKRAELKKRDLCVVCHEPRTHLSRLYCEKHRQQHMERNRRHDHKRKRGSPNQGIPTRKEKLRTLRYNYGQNAADMWVELNGTCELCGVTHAEKAVHVHHIDCDRHNDERNNLSLLCFRCHKLVHLFTEHPDSESVVRWIADRY